MFTSAQIRPRMVRIERAPHEKNANVSKDDDDDESSRESPATVAKRARQFATIQQSMSAPELGTS